MEPSVESRITELLVSPRHGLHREHAPQISRAAWRRRALHHDGYASLFFQKCARKPLRKFQAAEDHVAGTGGDVRGLPAALPQASASRGPSEIRRAGREAREHTA